MELIKIVDEQGNFTGEIMERKKAHDKNLLHNEISVFVINSKKQVLLQKRSANKRFNPNKWGLCAGHVKASEDLITAVLRELKEELGIEVSKNDIIPFGNREILLKEKNSHITYFYYLKSNLTENDFTIQKEELSEVKWFDIDIVINSVKNNTLQTIFTEGRLTLLEKLKEL